MKVEKEDYARNSNASYCTRPTDMVDTIVIHHSETPSTDTAQDMNWIHLNNGSRNDPWLMIGYSFVINSAYPGNTRPAPRVSYGRPLEIIGAHAGSNVFIPMSQNQKKYWDAGKIVCGKVGEEFKVDPTLVRGNRIKANTTTLGLVVIGNYAKFSKYNPNGYRTNGSRIPTKQTLELTAKMSCQLQKKYPNIKFIRWHSFYHSTTCPGDLKNYIGQIRALAKGYGCEFY